MSAGILSTPRAAPGRLAPTVAAAAVILLALPVFAVAGWPLEGWALAAVLWAAALAFSLLLTRLPSDPGNLAAASMRGIGTTMRALFVAVALVAVTVGNESVGFAAACVYALAFTAELVVGLVLYVGGEAKA